MWTFSSRRRRAFSKKNLTPTVIFLKKNILTKHVDVFFTKKAGIFREKSNPHCHFPIKKNLKTCGRFLHKAEGLANRKLTSTFIFLQKACGRFLALHRRYSTLERFVHFLFAVGVPAGTVVTLHARWNSTIRTVCMCVSTECECVSVQSVNVCQYRV